MFPLRRFGTGLWRISTTGRCITTLMRKYPLDYPSLALAEGLAPKLTVKQQVYEEVKCEVEEKPLIDALLTVDVPGLGVMGTVVSVHRNRFWRYLYPCQMAELPSPERLEYFRGLTQNRPPVLSGEGYESEQRLSNMTLYIPMNPASEWTLTTRHVKVAFRKYDIVVDESSITLPKDPITRSVASRPFKIHVKLFRTAVRRVLTRGFASKHRAEAFRLQRSINQPSSIELVPLSPANQAALNHFDKYYTQIYGSDQWSAMRVALLCPPTKAAVVNQFSGDDSILSESGRFRDCVDLMTVLSDCQTSCESSTPSSDESVVTTRQPLLDIQSEWPDDAVRRQLLGRNRSGVSLDPANLSEFVPVRELISESEVYTRDADEDFTLTLDVGGGAASQDSYVSEEVKLPDRLRVFCLHGNRMTHYFGNPRPTDGQYDFYPLDLASVVPVLALNLKEGDRLLDMCAAPGGKSVVALQTLLLSHLVCMDNAQTRLDRLQQVLAGFGPSTGSPVRVDVIHETQLSSFVRGELCADEGEVMDETQSLFDAVLVDVPCSTDRHAISSDQGSLFSPGRAKARMTLSTTQSRLLRRAMNVTRPGGTVVYSTCTLSPAQNQAVVQSCLNQVNQFREADGTEGKRFALVDLRPLMQLFHRAEPTLGLRVVPVMASELATGAPIGLLVVPSVSANYGPMFVAKLRRLS